MALKNKTQFQQMRKDFCTRAVALDTSIINEEERSIRTVMTTENPAIVVDWGRYEIIREILLMSGIIEPAGKKVVLLDNHSRWGGVAEVIKGSALNCRVENNEYVCDTQFSSLAEKEWTLAKEGHLSSVSQGYKTFPEHSFVIKAGETAAVNGKTYNNDYPDKRTLIIRTKWEPLELSLVPIGADKNAKFRSFAELTDEDLVALRSEFLTEPEPNNNDTNDNGQNGIKNISIRSANTMDEPVKLTEDQIRQAERERIQGIEDLAGKYANNYKLGRNGVKAAIEKGMTVLEFKSHIFDNFDDTKPVNTPITRLGMSEGEVKRFSITRAILSQGEKNWNKAGFEKEVCDEVRSRIMKSGDIKGNGGFFLPEDILSKSGIKFSERGMTVGAPAAGGNLVGTDFMPSEFVELARNRMVTGQAGIRVMSGLTGNIAIPKQTGTAIFGWQGENGQTAASNMTIGQITMSPKEGNAKTNYSRKLLLQGLPSVDMLVMDDLNIITALAKDQAVLHGAGGNQPLGLVGISGTGGVDGIGLGHAQLVEFETDVAVANMDAGTLKFITNPIIRGLCKTREIVQGYPMFLMGPDGKLNGYDTLVSNQVNNGHIFFGDWSQIWMGDWGGVEINVRPQEEDGSYTIVIYVAIDVGVRQAGAFSISTNVN